MVVLSNITYSQSFINKTITATSDAAFPLATADLWLYDVNIQIVTNDAYTGDRSAQNFEAVEKSVQDFRFLNLADFFVKNKDSGSNVVVSVGGTVMSPKQIKLLGV